MKTHSGEKSNKCKQCDYASSRASSLRQHLKIHSGEKSNKCNQCDYVCTNLSSLRTHLKLPEEPCGDGEMVKEAEEKWLHCHSEASGDKDSP